MENISNKYRKMKNYMLLGDIIENQFEGPHEWWNMHPAKFPDEHQSGIHGVGSPSKELFK